MWLGLLLLPYLLARSTAKPFGHVEYHPSEDIATVESIRRDVRQPAPLRPIATEVKDLLAGGTAPKEKRDDKTHMKNAAGKSDEGGYYKTYGSDAEGEKGYVKATFSNGDHGYKTFDTFHKQDGDNYEFEKHVAFGKGHDGKKSGYQKDAGSGSGSVKDGDHEGAGTIVDTHYTDERDHGDHGNEYSRYIGDTGNYGDDGARHVETGPESSSYGHSESYTRGKDGDGSYESHSSYSADDGGEYGHQGGHY